MVVLVILDLINYFLKQTNFAIVNTGLNLTQTANPYLLLNIYFYYKFHVTIALRPRLIDEVIEIEEGKVHHCIYYPCTAILFHKQHGDNAHGGVINPDKVP